MGDTARKAPAVAMPAAPMTRDHDLAKTTPNALGREERDTQARRVFGGKMEGGMHKAEELFLCDEK